MIQVYASNLMCERAVGYCHCGWLDCHFVGVLSSFSRAFGKLLHCMFIYSYMKTPHDSESSDEPLRKRWLNLKKLSRSLRMENAET